MPDLDQLVLTITIVLMGTAVHLVARPWKQEELFFVPLPRLLDGADRARARRVTLVNALCCLGALACLLAGGATGGWWWLALAAPWVSLGWLLVEFRGLTRPFARECGGGASLRRGRPVLVPLELVHGSLVASSAAVFAWLLTQLPPRVPLQWGAGGQVGRYGSASEMWAFLGVVLFNLVLTWLLVAAITRQRRIRAIVLAVDYSRAYRQLRYFLAHFVEWLMFAINVCFVAVWLGLALANLPGQTWLLTLGTWGGVALMGLALLLPLAVYLPSLMRLNLSLREVMGAEFLRLSADN